MIYGKYYAVPLHMHSTFEGNASMRGHMYQANRLGIEYIWITDHDFLMGKSENWVDGFSFADGMLGWCENPEITERKIADMFELVTPYGIVLDKEQYEVTYDRFKKNLQNIKGFAVKENNADCKLSAEKGKMKITARSSGSKDWEKAVVDFYSSGNRTQHTYRSSLITDMTVSFPFECAKHSDDVRIIFFAKMSQQLPDFKNAGIKYVVGNAEGIGEANYAVIPVEPVDGKIVLNLSSDAEKYVNGGLDNTFAALFVEVEVRNGKNAEYIIGDVSVQRKYEYEEALDRQRKLAAEIGKEYGVTPIVTNEITAAGQHKISFCTKVPVIDYTDGPKDHNYAVEWVKNHGGIFSLNHPFFDWERVEMSDCDKAVAVDKLAQYYIDNKCWGASMLEVGFPCKRSGFSLQQHLVLWDKISAAGIFITGYGDSDNHANNSKWFEFNNFCGFIYSENPGEESFVNSMKSGNLFTGDPVYFKGNASFKTSNGKMMGSVVEFDGEYEKTVCMDIYDVPENSRLVWIVNGVPVSDVEGSGQINTTLRVPLERDINFVRGELYNADGRCIMLTNPIYFVKKGSVSIPDERK